MNASYIRSAGFCLAVSLLETWALCLILSLTVKNAASLLFFTALCILHSWLSRKETEKSVRCGFLSFASLVLSLGCLLANAWTLAAQFSSRLFQAMILLVLFFGSFSLFLTLLRFIDLCRSRIFHAVNKSNLQQDGFSRRSLASFCSQHIFLITFLICLICYLPYFLYEFPGIMSPDGVNQVEQAVGARSLSNHHPVAHTMVIRFFYQIGRLFTDDVNTAVSFYTFAQMAFHALCCAAAVRTLHRFCVRRWVLFASIAFYALIPFQAVYAVMVGKDTVFGDICVLLTCCLAEIISEYREAHSLQPKTLVRFTILSVLFCLFRSNGWYAFLVMIPFLLTAFRKAWKQMLLSVFCTVLAAGIIRGPVLKAAGIPQPDTVESLCVPIQQISKVVADGCPLSEQDRDLIDAVVSIDAIPAQYNPVFADDMKELIRTTGDQSVIAANRQEYLSLYIRLGLSYPMEYIKAWTDLTEGYWYPDYPHDTANIDNVYNNIAGLSWQPILGGAFVKIKEIFLKLGSFVPVYGLLWSSGFYCLLLVLAAALCLHRTKKTKAPQSRLSFVLVLPSLMVLFTLFLAAPISAEFRYTLAETFSFPVWGIAPWLSLTKRQSSRVS